MVFALVGVGAHDHPDGGGGSDAAWSPQNHHLSREES